VVGDIVAIRNQVADELVLKFKPSMIATDVNAHGQFNHGS
jgi:hypothetical protein